MSDYVRNVSVFYPISEELCEKLDCELEKPFNTEVFDDGCSLNYYLCYVLKHTYGEESTGFGLSRMLTQDETNKYVDLFSDYLNNIDPNKFKLIDYCYYNCCECKDYYKNNDPNFQIICQDCKLEEQAHNLISENDAQEIKEENDANSIFLKSIQDCVTKGINQAIESRNDEVLEIVNKSINHYRNLLNKQDDFVKIYNGVLSALIVLKEQLGFSLSDDEHNFLQTIKQ